MAKSPPWFRFYSETSRDRKIERIARALGLPRATVVGTWAILLSIGNDSPVRGVLLLTEECPFTEQDIADEIGMDIDTTHSLLGQFENFQMIHCDEDGAIYLTNWSTRQFDSDHSSTRVQRYRDRKKLESVPTCNEDVTLHGSDSNLPEQNRAYTEQNRDRDNSYISPVGVFLNATGGAINPLTVASIEDLVDELEEHRQKLGRASPGADLSGEQWFIDAVHVANASNTRSGPISFAYVAAIVRNWITEGYKAKRRKDAQADDGAAVSTENGKKVLTVKR